MKSFRWVVICVVIFLVGVVGGYAIWGRPAEMLMEVEDQMRTVQNQLIDLQKTVVTIEAELDKANEEKLALEKQSAELREALEKRTKGRR